MTFRLYGVIYKYCCEILKSWGYTFADGVIDYIYIYWPSAKKHLLDDLKSAGSLIRLLKVSTLMIFGICVNQPNRFRFMLNLCESTRHYRIMGLHQFGWTTLYYGAFANGQ